MPWTDWRGAKVKKAYDLAARAALFTVAKEIVEAAIVEVPELSGDLKKSGQAKRSRTIKPSARIMFGGPYAIRWHENLEGIQFKRGRKKRFLADPFERIASRRIPVEYRRELRKRGQN